MMNKESLSEQLKQQQEETQRYYALFSEERIRNMKAQDELKLYRDAEMRARNERESIINVHHRELMEIIRWLANPETAKDPFNDMEWQKKNMPYRP